jgi:hypothetical protein
MARISSATQRGETEGRNDKEPPAKAKVITLTLTAGFFSFYLYKRFDLLLLLQFRTNGIKILRAEITLTTKLGNRLFAGLEFNINGLPVS